MSGQAAVAPQPAVTLSEQLAAYAHFKDPVTPQKPSRRLRTTRRRSLGFSTAVPPPFDWRDKNILSGVRHQLTFNTCTSFAIAAAVEANLAHSKKARVRLSPGFIHTCLIGHGEYDGVGCEAALDEVKRRGIAPAFDGDYPYPKDRCAQANLVCIQAYSRLGSEPAAITALAAGPILADMYIDPPLFLALGAKTVYKYAATANRRLHTVAVVGYDAQARYWIIQNSQGTAWADKGFGMVAFGSGGILTDRFGWSIVV